jgi:hypothetical protein
MQWMSLQYLGFASIIPVILLLYLLKRKYENQEVSSVLLWRQMLQNIEVNRPFQKLWKNLLLLLQLLAALLLVLALLKPVIPTEGAIAKHTVLVVDSSGSMLAKEGERTRFELAKQEAQKVIENLRSDQALTLIEAGNEPKVLISKSADKLALQNALNGIAARTGTADSRAALSLAKAIATSEPGSGIMWFGDGGAEQIPEAERASIDPDTFRFVQVGKTKENVAIGTFATQTGEQGVQALLRIDNHGIQRKTGKVAVYDEQNRLLDAAVFEVAAKESQTLQLSGLPPAQAYQAVLDLPQDGLAEDNRLWSVPFTAEQARAVLVSPNGNRFLHEVLKIGNRLQVERMNQVPKTLEAPADLWIFDGVVPDRLPQGNILLIAPDRTADWLPYRGEKEVAARLELTEIAHPLLQYADWSEVHVAKAADFGEIAGMKALVRAGEDDLVLAGTIAGRRVVILAFDLHQSDFPLRPAFPIFMQNAIAWLSPVHSLPIPAGYPGEPLEIPLTPGATKRSIALPDGTVQEINATGTSFLYQIPEQVGSYRLTEYQGEQKLTRYFTVQMREAESKIAPQKIAIPAGREQASESEAKPLAVEGINGYQDVAFWLVLLALVIVFAEWRVYQRGY